MKKHLLPLIALCVGMAWAAGPAKGPLRKHATNPRYFDDGTGRAVYLSGSHTWASVQDILAEGHGPFEYDKFLDFLEKYNHNFTRLWMWEQTEMGSWSADKQVFTPNPWKRTGPGIALDGKPKFDLDQYDDAYFQRLRARCEAAGRRGIYVSVMLFQGWSVNKTGLKAGDPWPFNPFNASNNIQGVGAADGGPDADDKPTLHSMKNPELVKKQEAYVRKVVDTVNDLDNVLYEILNEGGTIDWTYHMIRVVKQYEATKPKRHPVGMTQRISPNMWNSVLWESPADWVSPGPEPQEWAVPGAQMIQDYKFDPPASDGAKVVINDTDHLWGHGVDPKFVWKSMMRGMSPILMDVWRPIPGRLDPEKAAWMLLKGGISKNEVDYPGYEMTRRTMGKSVEYARRMNMAEATPHGELTSSKYCLAVPGREYLVYMPNGGKATVDLRAVEGMLDVEWYLPTLDKLMKGTIPVKGGSYEVFEAPFETDAVLYLRKR
jgi:hypothetical protein